MITLIDILVSMSGFGIGYNLVNHDYVNAALFLICALVSAWVHLRKESS